MKLSRLFAERLFSQFLAAHIACRVLVTDDRANPLKRMSTELASRDFEIIPTRTGEDALMVAQLCNPDVVIMDGDLGEGAMDGIETLQQIRDHPTASVPRMIVRSNFCERYKRKAESSGLSVDLWTDPDNDEKLLDFLDQEVKRPLREQMIESISATLGEQVTESVALEKVASTMPIRMGQVRLLGSYKGHVAEIGPPTDLNGAAFVRFRDSERQFVRVFPRYRLEAAGADFPDAEVNYSVYEMGAVGITVLRQVGPDADALLGEDFLPLSEEALGELDV